MNQMILTESERAKALMAFGYTETEARFLVIAALQGGYFFRRQYSLFLGKEDGGTITQLVQKALDLGHAKASTWRQNTQLYHLCARPFYEAIGQGDNRNRRMREMATIKVKIMGLDYVLSHLDCCFLPTDQEKLDYFIRVLQVDPAALPFIRYRAKASNDVTTRYFIEKFPISIAEKAGSSPVVTFCFVDEGLTGLSAFESFLARYAALFGALKAFEVVYVADRPKYFEAAHRRFERMTNGEFGVPVLPAISPDGLERLLDYFETRRSYEAADFGTFDKEKLIRFRAARESFSGKEYDALFRIWKSGGGTALDQILNRAHSVPTTFHGTFSTFLLDHDYSLFVMVTAA